MRRTLISTLTALLACVLLAAAVAAAPSVAAPADTGPSAVPSQEQYYESFGARAPSAPLAQEHYYSSYGAPSPVSAVQPPAVPSSDGPFLPLGFLIAAGFGVIAAAALEVRRIHARTTAAGA